jgi:GMP synthase (glutamine-hydrolysing)
VKNPQKLVFVLEHHPCEGPGVIADALRRAGAVTQSIRADAGERVPKEIGDVAGLIVMGGPQSVYEHDKFQYLRNEIRLIENALDRNRPVLGVCLGSQLIAAVLGAKVYPGRKKEIGWHRVDLTNAVKSDPLWKHAPRSFRGFHWHGDIFDLPRGATLLASSALTANQAFRYGRNAYAILFHMEITSAQVRTMVETFSSELLVTGLNPRAITLNAHLHLPVLHSIGQTVFTRWAALLS